VKRYVFDTEFNGFLEDAHTLHSLVLQDLATNVRYSFADQPGYRPLAEGLVMMSEADELIGHYIIGYDLRALKKVRKWSPRPGTKITDTVVLARVLFTDMGDEDNKRMKKGTLDKGFWNSNKLEAWGQRLGNKKMKYELGFDAWNPTMQVYCEQDVDVSVQLYHHLMKRIADLGVDPDAPWWKIEHGTQAYCNGIEEEGFPFDRDKAVKLYGVLAERRAALDEEVKKAFQAIYVSGGLFTPKKDLKRMNYTGGVTFTKVELQEFNPQSRPQIIDRLRRFRGWRPTVFTENGNPTVDDDVLRALPWPEYQTLGTYFMVSKRIGQLAEGDEAWLKVEKNGVVHGGINPGGTNTGRASHSHPNIAQVPAITNKKGVVPYGRECRELFTSVPGWILLGSDLSGIELRCLAHYLSPFDGGEYARTVVEGDVHMKTVDALKVVGIIIIRSQAKTFIYAYLYGAGDEKLGLTIDPTLPARKAQALGKKAREAIEANVPGLGELQKKLKKAWKKRGFIFGLDGRPLFPRSEHSVLNTLLQNAGAVIAKKWLLVQEEVLKDLPHRVHAWVHDEVQMSVKPEHASTIGPIVCLAATSAGIELGFQCRVDAAFNTGRNWAETH
jgi:DNA polymerase-1